MKIKHLLLLLLMFVGISAKAQNWTWIGETPAVETPYYLYTVEQKKFLNDNDGLDVTPSVLWTLGGTFPGDTNNNTWCTLTSAAGRQLSMSNSGSTLNLHTNSTGLEGDQVHFAFNLENDKYAITRTTKMTYKIAGIQWEVQRNIKSTTTFLTNDKNPSKEWLFILEAQVEANINYVEAWNTANAYKDNKLISAELKSRLTTALEKTANVNNAIDIIEELNTVANDCKTYLESVSPDNPIDATGFIVNPSIYQDGGTNDVPNGWMVAEGTVTGNSHVTEGTGDTRLEAWHWTAELNADYYQVLNNIPNGKYRLTAVTHQRNSGNGCLYAKTSVDEYSTLMPVGDGNEATTTVNDIVVMDNTLRIGMKISGSENWATADDFTLTYLGASATMTVNADAKYGTFCAPFDVTIPGVVTAYTVSGVEGNALVMASVETTIQANTPVILYAEEGFAATTFYGMAVAGTPVAGLLTGVYTKTDVPEGSYLLLNGVEGIGFYKVEGPYDVNPSVGPNRCYLTLNNSNAPAFFFDTETAIEAVEALTQGTSEIYNLNGVKQQSLQKGINIVKLANGKTQKVLVK